MGNSAYAERLRAGDALGRYELVREVGRGGMGTVWAARHRGSRGFSKVVALKVMRPHEGEERELARMFLAEAKLVAEIDHANVCRVLDLGEDGAVLYQALEWIEGDSLAAHAHAAGGRVPAAIGACIGRDVARGLAAAHARAIVHRDVSPQNVLVGTDGVARIADFGVAQADGAGDAPAPRGKARYVAPEQLYGEAVDARSDVFALGVVLYEATTGVHPFAAPTDVATMGRIADAEPAPSASTVCEGYPRELAAVLSKAIAKAPEERWASAAELASALGDALRALDGGSAEDVAAFVKDTMGSRLAEQRAGIEASTPPGAAPRRARRVALLASAGVAMAALTAVAAASMRRGPAPAVTSAPVATSAQAAITAEAQAEPVPQPSVAARDDTPLPAPASAATATQAAGTASPHSTLSAPRSAPAARSAPAPTPTVKPADHAELRSRE